MPEGTFGDEPIAIDFTLATTSAAGQAALILLGDSRDEIVSFLTRLVDIAYPPFGVSKRMMTVDDREGGFFSYTVWSDEGELRIAVLSPPNGLTSLVRKSLLDVGSVCLVFGITSSNGEVALLDPTRNHIAISVATLNGEIVHGRSGHLWRPYLESLSDLFVSLPS